MADAQAHDAQTHDAQAGAATPASEAAFGRDRFTPDEFRRVLSAYDIGAVTAARELHAGTSWAPKALIETDQGLFVLKRRETGREDPFRVAQTHDLQLRLADAGVPVPELVGTRADNNSMVQLGRHVYELTRWVTGSPFSGAPGEAYALGAAIAYLHAQLLHVAPSYKQPPRLDDPPAATVAALNRAADQHPSLAGVVEDILRASGSMRDRAPAPPPERSIWLHGDWHPGNVLFHEGRVSAIFDFDGVHLGPRRLDLGQAIAHFSADRRSGPPETWSDAHSPALAGAIWSGYASLGTPAVLPEAVAAAAAEALALEVAMAAAGAGPAGRAKPEALLGAVLRRIRWLDANAQHIAEACARLTTPGNQD